ncbi:MAG: GNAT family N-acetyltransferase [Caldilineales bacterium]
MNSDQKQPVIETERLVLRPFTLDDAADVQRLAGDPDIADTTLVIPHPYPDGAAESWINTHQERWDNGLGIVCAITLRSSGELIGAISVLSISKQHGHGELGYWVGKPYWNNGYCTEAARGLIRFCFETLGLHRVHAYHFARNPASGRVMAKAGMRYEGTMRQHLRKGDAYEDLPSYGILAGELQE